MHRRLERFAVDLLEACHRTYGADLVSVAIYGSWARQTATPVSDIDLLIVSDRLPSSRRRRVEQFGPVEAATTASRSAIWEGGPSPPELSPVLKTPVEVESGAPLYLDMTEWCEILHDRDRFLHAYLEGLRERMRANGTRRVWAKGGYYWEYKPDVREGEVIRL